MKTKLLLLAMLAFSQMNAQLVLHEPFNYSLGSDSEILIPLTGKTLTGVGTWANFSGGTPDDVILVSQLWFNSFGLPTPTGNAVKWIGSGSDLKLPFTEVNKDNATDIYYSCLIQINNWHPDVTVDPYRNIHLLNSTNNVGASVYLNRTTGGKLKIGYSPADLASEAVYFADDYEFENQYLLVVKYTFSGSVGKMWINPIVSSTEPTTGYITTSTTTKARTDFSGFAIQQGSNARNPEIQLDEVRVATTWAAVLGQPPLSVAKNEIEGLNVYPNPVSNGILHISSENTSDKTAVVFDMLGRQILSSKVVNGSINVSTLTKGNYVVKIVEGDKTSVKKIVIE